MQAFHSYGTTTNGKVTMNPAPAVFVSVNTTGV
jgi:hypothetical protein